LKARFAHEIEDLISKAFLGFFQKLLNNDESRRFLLKEIQKEARNIRRTLLLHEREKALMHVLIVHNSLCEWAAPKG